MKRLDPGNLAWVRPERFMLTATACDTHVEQLFDRVRQLHRVFGAADIPYRIVGGLPVFLHVSERDPIRARLTADVDAGVNGKDLPRILAAAKGAGWEYRRVAGVETLVEAEQPRARSAIHLVFLNEKVRPEYSEPVPSSSPVATGEGILLAPVADLLRMKLTSYRLKDRVHIQDLDGVGLIIPEMETELSPFLKQRLDETRSSE